ncbi:hypothetical protein HPP92_024677 [Vanilla planifolia]|uniref:Mediator of RNA polymerase II transcription subunit 33A n=1 Tax=Vanilla planifolia TaxID=51239 RepID=A0A835PIM8_VANPL|nr:hypothetical protein HPP92_024677 [Vanilla planifolia]
METTVAPLMNPERRVMEVVKASEGRGDPPIVCAMEVAGCVGTGRRPSPELGEVLVSLICFANNTPFLWKLLEQAMSARIVSPLHILALLTARVITHRRAQPEAYRLYLELLSRYGVPFSLEDPGAWRDQITKCIDKALLLSSSYEIDKIDFCQAVIFFVLTIITNLMDGILEDLGIKFLPTDELANSYANEACQAMDIDSKRKINSKVQEHHGHLCWNNTMVALGVVEKMTADKKMKVFLRLIHLNMPTLFDRLMERLQFVEDHRLASQSLKSMNHSLDRLLSNIHEIANGEYKLNRHQLLGSVVDAGFGGPTSCYSLVSDWSACWISFDMLMENAMDGRNLYVISAVEILTDMTKTLQVVNQASWQETFMALWVSALRLVQRDREPWEGPIPHLDARLCMLLSIVPLAIASIVKEELDTAAGSKHSMETKKSTSRIHGLVSSLKILGQYTVLLSPPPTIANAANNAAAKKTASFIASIRNGNGGISASSQKGGPLKTAGSLFHLIVEACIARKLIDTSAYFWPGYVTPCATSKDSMLVEDNPWSAFLEGSPLTGSLKKTLMAMPASSLVELEKLYYIALNGSDEEKSAAAKILCGASLIRGWNIQEHVVRMVVKLLSPPITTAVSEAGTSSHLIGYMPMISAVLFGVCSVEAVHIISLYGMVPELAAALIPLCEAFGSFTPLPNHKPCPFDEMSIYSVFSCAFLLLLRLWKFFKPPQEHYRAGRGGNVHSELTLNYLLSMHNHCIAVQGKNADKPNKSTMPASPVYIDSFPKLRAWYLQNQACIASPLSGLCSKNPVHRVADLILRMVCHKMNQGGNLSANPSSTSSSSISEVPDRAAEDAHQIPLLPAWDILEAVPFVLDAILTACANGRLSSRDLTTGLRDLADFLPASLAAIVSYFSAELTRGIWKPVAMNGIDWPSPSANIHSLESEVKEILAAVGVTIPSCFGCGSVPMLPLPMAALVSLTITFKLDKSLEYMHAVIDLALENCSVGSSWPCMPIIGALWAQKVRRWHDFIVLTCTRSPFAREKDAVSQLIHSCFSSFLGPSRGCIGSGSRHHGISGLLGHSISDHGFRLQVAPGYLYLRSCRSFHDMHFVNNVILNFVLQWMSKLSSREASSGPSVRLLSSRSSLAAAASAVRQVAMLGASLLCIAGGPLLVQVLYEETVPAKLLSASEAGQASEPCPASTQLLEGYAMAYMLVLSGAFIWGVGKNSPTFPTSFPSRHVRALEVHIEFIARMVDGNMSVGCNPVTWRAYVSCLVGLLVRYVPSWIPGIRKGSLRKLASALRGWNELELAQALLERGGPASIELVIESML